MRYSIISALFPALLLITTVSFGQGKDTSTVTLDLLRAPSSPAANLLGISPSEIEKPSDLSAFRVSLNQATNNFTQLPKSYAVDFSPGLIFSKSSRTIDEFRKNDFATNFRQSFTLSAGIRNLDAGEEDSLSPAKTKVGLGFKFSIKRGELADDGLLSSIVELQKKILNGVVEDLQPAVDADVIFQSAKKKMVDAVKAGDGEEAQFWKGVSEKRREELNSQTLDKFKVELAQLKTLAANFKMTRIGFKADVAGGIALDYLDQRFSNCNVAKAGVWVTAGWEGSSGLTCLLLGRYLYQPDKIFADKSGTLGTAGIHTLDGGGRLIYSSTESRFSISSEIIYRSVLNKSVVPSSWRLTVNADYDLGKNQKITFAFGRDFDGTVSRSGNLIAALNFLAGFGSKKSLF